MAKKFVDTKDLDPIKITFKLDEKWLGAYANKHSSPAAWIKDLMIADYEKTHKEEPQQQKQNSGMFDLLD